LRALVTAINHSPPARHALAIIVVCVVLGLLVHLLLTSFVLPGAGGSVRWTGRGARGAAGRDPWALAQQLASEGRYTEAAHALYGALLARVAARVPLRLHPSKTAGDYARDLRGTAPSVFGPFREFARSYEVVIYGLGSCDQRRFQTLIELAGRIEPELGRAA
jgi:hypothetical protein